MGAVEFKSRRPDGVNQRLDRRLTVEPCSLHPRIIAGGSVDRRNLATHRPNVCTELPAMMDGIEEEIPKEIAKRLFHNEVFAHVQSRWAFPVLFAERVRAGRIKSRRPDCRRRSLTRRCSVGSFLARQRDIAAL